MSIDPMTTEAVATYAQVVPAVMIALVVDLSLGKAFKSMAPWGKSLLLVAAVALVLLEIFLIACLSLGIRPCGCVSVIAIVVLGAGVGFLFVPFLFALTGGDSGPSATS